MQSNDEPVQLDDGRWAWHGHIRSTREGALAYRTLVQELHRQTRKLNAEARRLGLDDEGGDEE